MKIKKMAVRNIARIVEIDIEPQDSGLVEICGKNGAGKTSLLRSIFAAFGGEVPELRDGASRGSVRVETENLLLSLTVTPKGSRLVVEDVATPGQPLRSPKTLLKSIFGKRAFDVFAFLTARPKEQIDILLNVVEIPVDLQYLLLLCERRVEINAGASVIECINSAYEQIGNERRICNREVKRLQGLIETYHDIVDVEAVDIDELLQLKEKAINRLKIEQQLQAELREIERLTRLLEEANGRATTLRDTLAELAPYPLTEIEEQIAKARQTNELALKCREKRQAIDDLQNKNRESAKLTDIMQKISSYKVDLMVHTRFPIDGMDIKSGQIYYNGIPLSSACGAEQLLVATAIAAAEIPADGLQALFIFDPPQLDSASMALLENFAQERGIQLWIAKVQEEASGAKIFLQEGQVTKGNTKWIE